MATWKLRRATAVRDPLWFFVCGPNLLRPKSLPKSLANLAYGFMASENVALIGFVSLRCRILSSRYGPLLRTSRYAISDGCPALRCGHVGVLSSEPLSRLAIAPNTPIAAFIKTPSLSKMRKPERKRNSEANPALPEGFVMCGRFTYKLTWEELVKLYRLTLDQPARNTQPRYNVCPTTRSTRSSSATASASSCRCAGA